MSVHLDKRRNLALVLVLVLLVTSLSACVKGKQTTGVSNLWRVSDLKFTIGQTRDQDILDELGPPSQLIALDKYTVYYYLLEASDKTGLITIIYNTNTQTVLYDRAIFFFDSNGILQRWSTSKEALPLHGAAEQCAPPAQTSRCP